MSDLNRATLIGRLGADPELRSMPSGEQVANFSIATSEKWKDKQSGEKQERTEWHRISFFGALAKVAGDWLHKGSQVYIEGQIRTRKWQDKQGNDRYSTEIIGRELIMLGSKSESQGSGATGGGGRSSSPAQQPQQRQAPAPSGGGHDDMDDDIPF